MALPVAVLAGAVVAAAVVHLRSPAEEGNYPTCPFLMLTGWYCPGCGSMRAVHALTYLDVETALARNPLATVALVGVVIGYVQWAVRRWTGRPRTRMAPAWVLHALVVLIVVYGVARNLPGMEILSPA